MQQSASEHGRQTAAKTKAPRAQRPAERRNPGWLQVVPPYGRYLRLANRLSI